MRNAASKTVEALFRGSLNKGEATEETTTGEAPVDFPIDGRTPKEVHEMQEYAYSELSQFARLGIRKDGYFCGSCRFFDPRPDTMPKSPGEHDGFCEAYKFRDRDYGCCRAWALAV